MNRTLTHHDRRRRRWRRRRRSFVCWLTDWVHDLSAQRPVVVGNKESTGQTDGQIEARKEWLKHNNKYIRVIIIVIHI